VKVFAFRFCESRADTRFEKVHFLQHYILNTSLSRVLILCVTRCVTRCESYDVGESATVYSVISRKESYIFNDRQGF